MKKITLLIFPLILMTLSLFAQIRLDVEGDAWIRQRLILGNTTDNNIFIGEFAGMLTTPGTPNASDGEQNVFIGNSAGSSNTSGKWNVFMGDKAGAFNTTGNQNVMIGSSAGRSNTTGGLNVFVGFAAGSSNTTGIGNIFIGNTAGIDNTTGVLNTFIGSHAGGQNTIGSRNTFIGSAGASNTTGFRNTFIGYEAGDSNTTGKCNTFLGINAGMSSTTSDYNTFLGENAGQLTSTGFHNTFVGSQAGVTNTTGAQDVFVGRYAGRANTSGFANTFSGHGAGELNTIGRNNAFIGSGAGNVNTTGGFITCIGTRSNVLDNNLTNATAIGESAIVDISNKVVLGNTSVTMLESGTNMSLISDKRYKKNIQEEPTFNHLNFILKLNPVSYQYNTVKLVKERQAILEKIAKTKDHQGETSSKEEKKLYEDKAAAIKAAQEKDKIRYTGFLAQEVEKAANETSYQEFSGIVKPDDNGGKYALRYAEFVVPLVGAVQEQQQLIDAHQEQLTARDQRIEKLEADVAELKELLQKSIASKTENSQQTSILESAKLGQNIPNPFTSLTKIPYYIPQNSKQAVVQVYTITGQLVKTINVRSFGEGTLELQTNGLSNGQYTYSLEIDGRLIETKKMNLVK